MSRTRGTSKEYIQAKKTMGHVFDAEKMIDDSYLDALQIMIDVMNDPDTPVTIKVSASKFIIEAHGKIAKLHGRNPVPQDYIVGEEVEVEAGEDNVISMKFMG